VKKKKMKSEKVKTKAIVLVICTIFLAAMSAVSLASTGINTQDKQLGIFEKTELNHAPSAVEYVPDGILVKFKPDVGEDKIALTNSEYGTSVKSILLSGTKILNVPSGKTVDEMVIIYESLPEVEYAEPNYIEHAFMVPNDPAYPYQWHLDNDDYGGINIESAWDISTGTGVVVAVLDSGVAYEDYGIYCQAPDLAGTTFVQGYDFVNNDAHPNDDEGHGTHVAGTIAQTTNNNYGIAGVAFGCSIMPIKTLNATGFGTHADFSNGVHYAVDHGADIISYSGGGSHSNTKEEAVEYAYTNGVTFVAAAGNEYEEGNPPQYPAAYDDYVIAVGATRYDETRSYYSNTGSYLDLTAPGGDTSVDQNSDGYDDGVLQQTFSGGDTCDFGFWFCQGTSMATPHVSGVAALVIANGVTGPDNVRNRLQSTAEDKGTPGWDEEYGWGLVDAAAALGGELPSPHITNVEILDTSISLGDSFTVRVDGTNNGGDANGASTISLSFPQLDDTADNSRVEYVSHDFTAGDEYILDPPANPGVTTIWHKDTGEMIAEYVLAEGGTSYGDWSSGEDHFLTLQVTPKEAGTFYFYVRETLNITTGGLRITDPSSSSYTRQWITLLFHGLLEETQTGLDRHQRITMMEMLHRAVQYPIIRTRGFKPRFQDPGL
jgi:serine protease